MVCGETYFYSAVSFEEIKNKKRTYITTDVLYKNVMSKNTHL